jgi:lysophospholipase L1-like esterase
VVYYLAQPDGGAFTVTSGPAVLLETNTEGATKSPGFADFAIPPDDTEIQLHVTSGQVRLFGYRFDKPGPGVQYSSLGINGAQVQMVLRFFAVDQWTAALRHEHPDLVVINYGTNESVYPAYLDKDYPGELRKVIARVRAAVPEASILVMSPMDRGVLDPSGEIVTPSALSHLVDIQQKVAAETGCAFFNTFEAMGGSGTMGQWYAQKPRLVSADFMHPLPAGAAIVGALFKNALVKSYQLHKTDAVLVSQN